VQPAASNKPTYLALGDSYTVGEGVEQAQSFPFQLAAQLRARGLDVDVPQVIAKTGWTTSELLEAIAAADLGDSFSFVTLLIGVNNQYRGESPEVYQQEFTELLQIALHYAGGIAAHVFVISIPDWGITPYGQESGRERPLISLEINEFNRINKAVSEAAGLSYTDITPASRLAGTDPSLVATDGLHPSEKMYRAWAQRLAGTIAGAFQSA